MSGTATLTLLNNVPNFSTVHLTNTQGSQTHKDLKHTRTFCTFRLKASVLVFLGTAYFSFRIRDTVRTTSLTLSLQETHKLITGLMSGDSSGGQDHCTPNRTRDRL
jgi:hypothetical protein